MEEIIYKEVCEHLKLYILDSVEYDLHEYKEGDLFAYFLKTNKENRKQIKKELVKLNTLFIKKYDKKNKRFVGVKDWFEQGSLEVDSIMQYELMCYKESINKDIVRLNIKAHVKQTLYDYFDKEPFETSFLDWIVEHTSFKLLILKKIEFLISQREANTLEFVKKPLIQDKDIKHPKEFDYIKIGVLIAQGKLTKTKKGYEYKKHTFDKIELEKELKNDLNIKSIRQYIEGTFGADAETTYKNDLRRNSTKIKKIVEYCVFYKKSITDQYQKLFDELG